ncbi:MAG TPA: hypothetical protein PKY30_10770 [Myxococcota bacterium]|nr:hypothetical protein [Myxococcota bacterium]
MICTYIGCGQIAQETVLSEQRRPGGIVSWIPKHFCPAHAANARLWSRQAPAPAATPSTPTWQSWIDLSQPAENP